MGQRRRLLTLGAAAAIAAAARGSRIPATAHRTGTAATIAAQTIRHFNDTPTAHATQQGRQRRQAGGLCDSISNRNAQGIYPGEQTCPVTPAHSGDITSSATACMIYVDFRRTGVAPVDSSNRGTCQWFCAQFNAGGTPLTCVHFYDEVNGDDDCTPDFGSGTTWPCDRPSRDMICECALVTAAPTRSPTRLPTRAPTVRPTRVPTRSPTRVPSRAPTRLPSSAPTRLPSRSPTSGAPTTAGPSVSPTDAPTATPSAGPTTSPTTLAPTGLPTVVPTLEPTSPTEGPTQSPTGAPAVPPAAGGQASTGGGGGGGASTSIIIGVVAGLILLGLIFLVARRRAREKEQGANDPLSGTRTQMSNPAYTGHTAPRGGLNRAGAPGVGSAPGVGGQTYDRPIPTSGAQYGEVGDAGEYDQPLAQNITKVVGGEVYEVREHEDLQYAAVDEPTPAVYAASSGNGPIASGTLQPDGAFGAWVAVQAWIDAGVSRSTAEQALTASDYAAGAYCLRRGRDCPHVLCVRTPRGTVAHFRITGGAAGDGKPSTLQLQVPSKVAGGSEQAFGTIHELLTHYTEHPVSSTVPRLAGCIPLPSEATYTTPAAVGTGSTSPSTGRHGEPLYVVSSGEGTVYAVPFASGEGVYEGVAPQGDAYSTPGEINAAPDYASPQHLHLQSDA